MLLDTIIILKTSAVPELLVRIVALNFHMLCSGCLGLPACREGAEKCVVQVFFCGLFILFWLFRCWFF